MVNQHKSSSQMLPTTTRPDPDPTIMTTEQLDKSIVAVKEIFKARVDGIEDIVVGNKKEIDKFPIIIKESVDNLKTLHGTEFLAVNDKLRMLSNFEIQIRQLVDSLVEEKIKGSRILNDERFQSIGTQLALAERQRVEQKADTKAAVDAALTAQKEAVKEQTAASERAMAVYATGTTKQIDQQAQIIETKTKGLDEKITASNKASDEKVGDLKDRVTSIEGKNSGMSSSWTILISVVMALIAICSVGAALLIAFTAKH